jgi:hypothetical protein
MQKLIRLVFLCYFVFLTMLLLSPNPNAVIGVHGDLPHFLQIFRPWAHLLSFSVLAGLAWMANWPAPRWCTALLMAAYGGATEILQGFVPPRHPAVDDWLQDLAGIVIGTISCWIAVWIVQAFGWMTSRPAKVEKSPKGDLQKAIEE